MDRQVQKPWPILSATAPGCAGPRFSQLGDRTGDPLWIFDVAFNDGYVVVGTAHEPRRSPWPPTAAGRSRRPSPLSEGAAALSRPTAWRGRVPNGHGRWLCSTWPMNRPDLDRDPLSLGGVEMEPDRTPMFSLISGNWAGEPLVSYETMPKYIRTTRSETGFRCRAVWTPSPTRKG